MKPSDRSLPHRRSVRLRGYDYSQPGAYFVTLCTQRMDCLFGTIVGGQMRVSPAGAIVQECWLEIPRHFDHAVLDEFVVMPNHLHGILVFSPGAHHGVPLPAPLHGVPGFRGTRGGVPRQEAFARPAAGSLASVLRLIKQSVTRRVAVGLDVGARLGVPLPIWQRNYYEHIIRNQDELDKIREYIRTNPLRWACDRYHPENGVLVQDETGRVLPWET